MFVSRPGRLNCRKIFHVVGPQWSGGAFREKQMLANCITACLQEACELGFQSIAIPAVSTGIYGYPVPVATEVIVNALKDYLEKRTSSLQQIYLMDIDEETVMYFAQALVNTFEGVTEEPTTQHGASWQDEHPIPEASGKTSAQMLVFNVM